MIIDEEDYLAHYGTLHKSGRYPWGSGETQSIRNKMFLDHVSDLQKQGLTDAQIGQGFGMSSTEVRALKAIAKNAQKQEEIGMAQRLHDKGLSNNAIGLRMGKNESSVRALLAPAAKEKADILASTSNMLKAQIAEKRFIDVGVHVEKHLGISKEKLATAVSMLKEEGYKVHYLKVQQLGTGHETSLKVLSAPDVSYGEVFKSRDAIQPPFMSSEDGGRSFDGVLPPLIVHPDRVGIRYAEDGGSKADGVIYVRPGVADLSLGKARYAQVRIAVGDGHYLKGMAMYKDGLPKGTDLLFNTNKSDTGNKLDALKPVSGDVDNPFGAVIRQLKKDNGDGTKSVTSAMNLVNEEGDWSKWSKSLSSQMLSKQSPSLAKTQLAKTRTDRERELKEIQALTNPTVRKKLLEDFADSTDAAAVHLKAAALPNQGSHVILPIESMNPMHIYAPNYIDGERVVLIRYPHGGTFEIPELIVNNKHPEADKLLHGARDAVGIHPAVAERLSGADFDGDTVLVIPNSGNKVKTTAALDGLRNFDPRSQYKAYEGMPQMKSATKQKQMGEISNLITDMTIQLAPASEIVRAVRHSMVVIDAEKHHLNYKQSAINNGIAQLKQKYQPGRGHGASTLISRAGSEARVPQRKAQTAAKGGSVDKVTGQKVYEPTGKSFIDSKGKLVIPTSKSTKLAETSDAHTLSSGTHMERVYADHSNALKAMANEARLAAVHTPNLVYSPSAKKVYEREVASLGSSLFLAERNAPLERRAQTLGNTMMKMKRDAHPDMDKVTLKRERFKSLEEARLRVGAKKPHIEISPREWEAIQAGAISNHQLKKILDNTDLTIIKQYATPRRDVKMTTDSVARAKALFASGHTRAQVAAVLGVSTTTLDAAVVGSEQ